MSAFNLSITLSAPAMQSGDDVAYALRIAADQIASTWDGLTMPEDSGLIWDTRGVRCGQWEVSE